MSRRQKAGRGKVMGLMLLLGKTGLPEVVCSYTFCWSYSLTDKSIGDVLASV
jgi:Ca2+/Na+ antiporter